MNNLKESLRKDFGPENQNVKVITSNRPSLKRVAMFSVVLFVYKTGGRLEISYKCYLSWSMILVLISIIFDEMVSKEYETTSF